MASIEEGLEFVISSKKVLARVETFELRTRTPDGQILVTKKTVNIYDYVLDHRQASALEEARDFASREGIILKVTDVSRLNRIGRLLRFGLARLEGQSVTAVRPMQRLSAPASSNEECGEVSLVACPP